MPKLNRNHVRHIAAEGVNTFCGPKEQNRQHLVPRGRNRLEVSAAVPRVNAIIQFDGLIPVAGRWRGGETIVAGGPRRELVVAVVAAAQVNARWTERLAGDVVEIVGRREEHALVVITAQVTHAGRRGVAVILAGHMVRDKIKHNLQARVVNALHESLKLFHPVWHVHGKFGADVVVVAYGVWRAGLPLHHMRVARSDTVLREVGACGMLNDAGWPHVGGSQVTKFGKQFVVNIVQFAAAVLSHGAAMHGIGVVVGEPTREELIDNGLHLILIAKAVGRAHGGQQAHQLESRVAIGRAG